MTRLARAITEECQRWLKRECRETCDNGCGTDGGCVDDLHRAYDGRVWRVEWCAKFAYVVVRDACKRLGVRCTLPQTASARGMRDEAKRAGLRVDLHPAVGSVFYRFSTSKSATGHIGVVVGGDAEGIWTIEGNLSKAVKSARYSLSHIANARNGFAFIHTEDIGNTGSDGAGGSPGSSVSTLAQIALLGTFGYLAYKNWS